MATPQEGNIALTATDLKDILKTAIQEAKQPTVLEKAELEEQARVKAAKKADRARQAWAEEEVRKNKHLLQKVCTHHQATGMGTHCVHIPEDGGTGYIFCQACQAVIRQGAAPKGYKGMAIYDSALYLSCLQRLNTGAIMS